MLTDITIIIPTFHRRGYLRDCLDGIFVNLPECETVVVSDDGLPAENAWYRWVTWWGLPYDSGLTAKRNKGVESVSTKYTLIGSDDFDFSTLEARKGIAEMALCLKHYPDVDVVCGRVNERPYEGNLEYVPGEYIKEHRVQVFGRNVGPILEKGPLPLHCGPLPVWKVDIAANYFLARTEVLREIPWDEAIRPIGGEHADWFLDLKAANKTVAFLPFANINQMEFDQSKQHPQYKEFRRRALTTGHALMKKKRNIKQYIDFNGGIS